MDYRKRARELANLLGKTSVDYHNKSIAIDFIETELKDITEQVKKMNYIPCCTELCDFDKHNLLVAEIGYCTECKQEEFKKE